MRHVCLVGLIAAGKSGVPRYAAALTAALDRVAPDFPELSMRLLTTHAGARAAAVNRIEVDLVGPPFAAATAGPRRIIGEQLAARRARGDLLHFFDLTGPVLAQRRPFVATVHDASILHGFERARVAHQRVLQPWGARHASAVVAVSSFAKEEAIRMFGADEGRIRVIHSGPGLVADTSGGTPPDGDPYVLYVGNFSKHKNLPFLIDAFAAAPFRGRLLLVGGRGRRLDEATRAADESSARDRIEIRQGATDAEIDTLYRGASMLVLPSLYEGFGFTALEAMARGCPVLASDIPALREICGDAAWLLPVNDGAAWSAAIGRLSADRELRDQLCDRGRAAVGKYSWDETARGVCRLFLDVTAR